MADISQRADLAALRDDDFKALIAGKHVPVTNSLAPELALCDMEDRAAIEDAADPDGRPMEDRIALMEDEFVHDMSALVPEFGVPADVLAVACAPVDASSGARVRFDGFSHSSRLQRAYVQCLNPIHKKCFRYRQVCQFEARQHAIAYLACWAHMGHGLSRAEHQSNLTEPSKEELAVALAERAGRAS